MIPLCSSSTSCLTRESISMTVHATASDEQQFNISTQENFNTTSIQSDLYAAAESQGE